MEIKREMVISSWDDLCDLMCGSPEDDYEEQEETEDAPSKRDKD